MAERLTSHVHQIYIRDDMELPGRMPALLEEHAKILRDLYPEATYKLWSGNDLREFINDYFEENVLKAFDKLQPYAYKSDLGRLCILHIYGGLYVDVAIRFNKQFVPPESYGLGIFADLEAYPFPPDVISNGIIWSEPQRPELMSAIRAIIRNCELLYYGENALCPTGPALFANICSYSEGQDPWRNGSTQWMGMSIAISDGLAPYIPGATVAQVSPSGETVAFRVKTKGGDLEFAGAKGVNNYNTIWEAGRVYGEDERVWALATVDFIISGNAERTETGVRFTQDNEAEITFSPEINLTPGIHRFAVCCSNFVGPSTDVTIKVLDQGGKRTVFERSFNNVSRLTRERLTMMFSTRCDHQDLQVKIHAAHKFNCEVNSISYIQVS